MPKYAFECASCGIQFERSLKLGEHPNHPCPGCQLPADRLWMGQGFGFGFGASAGTAQANTGVAKTDYPTADQAVGASADRRWSEYRARDAVKQQVRAQSEKNGALIRRNGKDFVQYEAGTKSLIEGRKKLVATAEKGNWGVPSQDPKTGKPKRRQ